MRSARRLIASAVLVGAALVFGAGTASADTGWKVSAPPAAASSIAASGVQANDTGWTRISPQPTHYEVAALTKDTGW